MVLAYLFIPENMEEKYQKSLSVITKKAFIRTYTHIHVQNHSYISNPVFIKIHYVFDQTPCLFKYHTMCKPVVMP